MKLSLSSANNRVKKNNLFHKNINFGLKKVPNTNKTVDIEDIKINIDTTLETITEVSETSSLNSPSINEIIKQGEKNVTFYESVTEETQTEEFDEPDNESVEEETEPVVEEETEPVVEEETEPVVVEETEPVVVEETEPVVEEETKEIIIEETPKKKRGRKKKSNN